MGIKRHLEVFSSLFRLKNCRRLSIRIIWNLHNGLKDIMIWIVEIGGIIIKHKREGVDWILILGLLRKLSFPRPIMELVLWFPTRILLKRNSSINKVLLHLPHLRKYRLPATFQLKISTVSLVRRKSKRSRKRSSKWQTFNKRKASSDSNSCCWRWRVYNRNCWWLAMYWIQKRHRMWRWRWFLYWWRISSSWRKKRTVYDYIHEHRTSIFISDW